FYAHHLVGRHHRVCLEIDLEPGLGHLAYRLANDRIGKPRYALVGTRIHGPRNALADLGLAKCRHPDDAFPRGSNPCSGGIDGSRPGGWSRSLENFLGYPVSLDTADSRHRLGPD